MKVVPEVDSPFSLKISTFSTRYVCLAVTCPGLVSGGFWKNFKNFLREGELASEVKSGCTRDKEFIQRWRRWGFSPVLRAFFAHSVQLDVECLACRDFF